MAPAVVDSDMMSSNRQKTNSLLGRPPTSPCKHTDPAWEGSSAPSMPKKNNTPEFLQKLYRILLQEDPAIICWENGKIHVRDPVILGKEVLHKYFRHSKYSSFQRQLNYFGFRKTQGKGKMSACTYTNNQLNNVHLKGLLCIKRKTSTLSKNVDDDCKDSVDMTDSETDSITPSLKRQRSSSSCISSDDDHMCNESIKSNETDLSSTYATNAKLLPVRISCNASDLTSNAQLPTTNYPRIVLPSILAATAPPSESDYWSSRSSSLDDFFAQPADGPCLWDECNSPRPWSASPAFGVPYEADPETLFACLLEPSCDDFNWQGNNQEPIQLPTDSNDYSDSFWVHKH